MNRGNNTTGAPARAQRLRDLAGQADNLGALASLADAQLSRVSADLQTLVTAAKRLAEQLTRAADGAEVKL